MRITVRSRPGVEVVSMRRDDDLTAVSASNSKPFGGLYDCHLSDGGQRAVFGEDVEVQL